MVTMKCVYVLLFCLHITLHVEIVFAALGNTCAVDQDCTDVAHAVCDTTTETGSCACPSAFNEVETGKCMAKALGDACAADQDCANVAHAVCQLTDVQLDTCACQSAFKADGSDSCTAKGLADSCSATTDCVAVNNSICNVNSSQCECSQDYKVDGDICIHSTAETGNGTETGELKALGDACTTDADCHDVDHAECIEDVCKCANGYKKYGIACVIVLDAPCGSASECTDHLANSKCDTKCVCDTNYTREQKECKIGHGMGNCTSVSDCVTNALCDANKKCMCDTAFAEKNGLCVASGAGSLKLMTDIVIVSIIVVSLFKLF